MALIKCKECGNTVSDKAMVCPHCGCVINANGAQWQNARPEGIPSVPYQTNSVSNKSFAVTVVVLYIIVNLALGVLAFFCYRRIEQIDRSDDDYVNPIPVPSEESPSYENDDNEHTLNVDLRRLKGVFY